MVCWGSSSPPAHPLPRRHYCRELIILIRKLTPGGAPPPPHTPSRGIYCRELIILIRNWFLQEVPTPSPAVGAAPLSLPCRD